MNLARLVLPTALVLLSGCAQKAEAPKIALQARVEIQAPKVDLPHLPRPVVQSMVVAVRDQVEPGNTRTLKAGSHTAVECNAARTECKHAIVLPVVHYQLVRSGNESAYIKGTFDVEVGRYIVDKYESQTMQFSQTRSIDDSVQVIEEGNFSYPLSAELKLNKPYIVEGRLGTRVTITLQRALPY
jgi:hypothetical protein